MWPFASCPIRPMIYQISFHVFFGQKSEMSKRMCMKCMELLRVRYFATCSQKRFSSFLHDSRKVKIYKPDYFPVVICFALPESVVSHFVQFLQACNEWPHLENR